MTNIFKIPAKSQAYLTAIRDSAADKFDVVGFDYNYANASILDGIWAYFKMEEDAMADRVNSQGDSSRDLHSYTDSPGLEPVAAAGLFGNAVKMYYRYGYLKAPLEGTETGVNPDLSDEHPFTYAFWYYQHNEAPSGDGYRIDYNCNIGMDTQVDVSAGKFSIDAWTDNHYLYTDALWDLEAWHLIVLRFTGAQFEVWVDNVLAASQVDPSLLGAGYGVFWIMGTVTETCWFLIDEHGIWRRALTEAELTYLWNDGAGRALF